MLHCCMCGTRFSTYFFGNLDNNDLKAPNLRFWTQRRRTNLYFYSGTNRSQFIFRLLRPHCTPWTRLGRVFIAVAVADLIVPSFGFWSGRVDSDIVKVFYCAFHKREDSQVKFQSQVAFFIAGKDVTCVAGVLVNYGCFFPPGCVDFRVIVWL